jgi:hypothetical protein
MGIWERDAVEHGMFTGMVGLGYARGEGFMGVLMAYLLWGKRGRGWGRDVISLLARAEWQSCRLGVWKYLLLQVGVPMIGE